MSSQQLGHAETVTVLQHYLHFRYVKMPSNLRRRVGDVITKQGMLAPMCLLSQTHNFSGIVDLCRETLLICEAFVLMLT